MNKRLQRGQSMVEVIIALAIFALISAALASLAVGGFTGLEQGGEQMEAEALAQEGIEAVRSIRDRAWNENTFTKAKVQISGSEWVFGTEGSTETIGQYTRTITFADVCRDGSDEIATCPATYTDVHVKEATVSVTWNPRSGITNEVKRVAYVTNWDGQDWTQTNWAGGSGQTTWSDATKYDSDDGNLNVSTAGQVSLPSGDTTDNGFSAGSSATNDWPFATAGNYTYDTDDIEVTGGEAKLKQSSTISGDTSNASFDVDSSSWTYKDWQDTGNNVSGTRQAIGGNPLGYVDVAIGKRKNSTLSGYWEQAFTTTVDNPTADVDFDWIANQYSSSFVTSFQLYVFVDTAAGSPTLGQQVWSSGEITGTTSWASVSNVDVSSKIGSAGTYYLKIAARVTTGGGGGPATGTNTVGYDNVTLHWEGTGYPTDEPSIYPTNSHLASGVASWNSFTETATKNGGEIYYQLTNDNGTTWQYWNGAAWALAMGATDYNTASVVNTNIGSFATTNEQIKFKAFLESDGSQLVKLDNVQVGYAIGSSPWSFDTWDIDGGELTPLGSTQSSGGNPDSYVDVTVLAGNNDEVGGYWEQGFTTYKNSPTTVTIDFDYKVVDYNGSPVLVHARVYVDSASGNPSNQVGSSISLIAEGDWTAATQIDATSAVPTAGTYYLKVALWVETGAGGGSGPFTIGFDNVDLELNDAEYPVSGMLTSSGFDMSDASPIQIFDWDESVPGAAYDIDLELSGAPDSGGSPGTWTSWYGESGVGDTFDDHNTRGVLVPTGLNDNQWVRYRLTLSGDGDDTPTLTETRINYK